MSKNQWLIGTALAMFIAAPAITQQPAESSRTNAGVARVETQPGVQVQVGPNVIIRRLEPSDEDSQPSGMRFPPPSYTTALIGNPPLPSSYWLGIQCSPVPAALRSHLTLPEKQGLLVMAVSKDSPAAKAGFAQYDILLRAGERPLVEPRDLLTAVEAAKETKLKIDLIRGGKPKIIEAAPVKRSAQMPGGPVQLPDQGDWNTIQNWLEGMAPGQGDGGPRPPVQFRLFQPGAIVPGSALLPRPQPSNLSISILKGGDEPAKITVKRNDEKWEVTEKDLGKLPADVRPYVEQMLGRGTGMFGVVGGTIGPNTASGTISSSGSGAISGSGGAFAFPPGMMQSRPFAGNLDPRLEKRFEEMNRRMDRLFKMMEELGEGRGQHAAPEQHEEK